MTILSLVSILEVLIILVVISCAIILFKMNKNKKKMVKLDEDLSHIRNVNNIIKDEQYLEMTLPFSPLI